MDALCFMVKTWARHKTTKEKYNGWRLGGERLVAVGWLAVRGAWRLAVGGGCWLAVGGPWGGPKGLSSTEKKMGFLKDSPW